MPLAADARPIAFAHTQTHHIAESALPAHATAPRRKRVVREEDDDQIWFKKRTKKITAQEQKEHSILAATLDTVLDVSQEEPPTNKKPVKRKVVRKRVLVPRIRQKESLKPQPDQPMSPLEPVVEDLEPLKKKKTKTLAVSKQTSGHSDTLDAPLLNHGDEDELSTHSIHTVSVMESAPSKKTKSSPDPQENCIVEKSRKKAVPRKKAERKHVQESVETKDPNVKESTQTTTTILLPEKEGVDGTPRAKTTRQQKVARKHSEKPIEQSSIEALVDAQPDLTHEANPPPKKKKLVRRVRVPRTTTRSATSEQDASVDMTNMVNKDDREPSVATNAMDVALSDAVGSAALAKKSSKTPKRMFFNDDSDIDLDQMLSGIAAIADTRRDTTSSTSKSNRVARRKIAV